MLTHASSHRLSIVARGIVALVALSACGGGSDGATPPPGATTGSLTVTVSGLPGDVAPSVTVTGPAGYSQTFSATRTLTGLTAGSYTVTGSRIADKSIGYDAPSATATVTAGGSTTASATYAVRILPRSTTNRTDESTAARVKVLYALPGDGIDRNLDTDGTLHRTLSSGQRWLASQTAGRSVRYDVADGGLDITFVRLPRTDAAYYGYGNAIRDSIEKDLKAVGWNQANVLLLTFYDGRHIERCGSSSQLGFYPGNMAGLYLKGLPNGVIPCANNAFAATPTATPTYWEFLTLHEVFHLLGFVGSTAPGFTASGHTGIDNTDLMYAGTQAWRPATVDVTKTNYYNATGLAANVPNFATSPYVVSAP
jgi:hypothetical protein